MASNFEFYSPTRVIFGKGTEQRVGALVREYGGPRGPPPSPGPGSLACFGRVMLPHRLTVPQL